MASVADELVGHVLFTPVPLQGDAGLLESYQDPGIDPAIDEQLQEYMARRRDEIGDGL